MFFRSSRTRLDLAIVFGVGLLANLAYLYFSNGDFYYPDSFTYLAPARSLLHGLGFVDASGGVETIRTPAYPLLLALFGARTLPVIIFQHVLNAGLAIGIYLLVLYRADRRPALIASLLFALDVPTIHYANKLLTETVFTALLYLVFVLALQRQRPIVVGALTGVLVLIRPIALFYFVVLALYFLVRRIPKRQLLVFVAVSLALPGAWALRNRVRTGVFTISSIGDFNLLTYRAAGALAIEDEGDFREAVRDEEQALIGEADDAIEAKLHIPDATELPDAVRGRYYAEYAWRVIREHPAAFIQLTIRGLLVNLFDSDWDAIWVVSPLSPEVLQLGLGAIPIVVLVLAVIGIIFLWRYDRPMALLIALTVVYFVVMSAGGEAESRFRVPVIPHLAIAAAMGVETIRRGLTRSASTPAS
jgi:4-amino-4-deoxy-L-arabinose transferase-like glycosyltransferase